MFWAINRQTKDFEMIIAFGFVSESFAVVQTAHLSGPAMLLILKENVAELFTQNINSVIHCQLGTLHKLTLWFHSHPENAAYDLILAANAVPTFQLALFCGWEAFIVPK